MADNSEAAFPRSDGGYSITQDGMTLRDYFAGQCIHSLLGGSIGFNINDYQAKEHARFAYMVADAMLIARDK